MVLPIVWPNKPYLYVLLFFSILVITNAFINNFTAWVERIPRLFGLDKQTTQEKQSGSKDPEKQQHQLPTYPPIHLPEAPQRFHAREQELEDLLKRLKPGTIYTLYGPGGIGKTAIASKALHTLTDGHTPPAEFPDGVIHYSFYGKSSTDLALQYIAQKYGVDLSEGPAKAAERALARRTALIFLDGTEKAEDLAPILAIRGNCGLLITSQAPTDYLDKGYEVKPLDPSDGLQVLAEWAEGYANDPDAAKGIWDFVGGHTLALRLAGRFMFANKTPAKEYIELLNTPSTKDAFKFLEESKKDSSIDIKHRHDSIAILLNRTLTRLSNTACHILALSGRLGFAPFHSDLIAHAMDLSKPEAELALGELVRFGLLNRSDDTYHPVHRMLHRYARQCKLPKSVVKKLAGYLIEIANEKAPLGTGGFQELNEQLPHILSTLNALQEADLFAEIIRLAAAIEEYLDLHGKAVELQQVSGMALTASRKTKDRRSESTWLSLLGSAYAALGDTRCAIEYLEKALDIARKIGDRGSEGVDIGNLGNAYAALGENRRAIEFYQQALEISRETGDRRGEGAVVGNLGLAYFSLGETRRAIEYHEQALEIAREIGDRRGEGNHLGNLGLAYDALSETHRAIEFYQQALDIAREISNRRREGVDLGNLGVAYAALGETRVAIEFYQQALEIAREIGNRRGEGNRLANLGNAYAALGETRRAIEYHEKALEIAREIGDRGGEGNHLGNLGNAYFALGEPHLAIEYHEQALEIAREIGDRRGEGSHLGNLGNAYDHLGEPRRAIEFYQQALEIAREGGDRRGEGNHIGNLGQTYADLGENRRAIELYQQALEIFRGIGDRRGEGVDLGNLGVAYADLGETRRAIEYHEKALEIAREIGDRGGEGNHLGNLGNAYADLGENRRAIEYLEKALDIARKIGDRRGEGPSLGNLGVAYATLGETRRAIEYHEQALEIAREIGDRRGEGNRLANLGNAYDALGETRRTIEYHEKALEIAREIGDRRGEGTALGNLGSAYADLGETRRAIEFYQQALEISREIGGRRGEGNSLGNLGNAYADLGEIRRAIEFYQQALEIAREIGDRGGEGNHLGNLGLAYAALGETRRAIEFYQQAIEIDREIGDRRGEGIDLRNLVGALIRIKEYEQAEACLVEAERLDPDHPFLHGRWGGLLHTRGDHPAAIQRYRQAMALEKNDPTEFNFGIALPLLCTGKADEAIDLIRARLAEHPSPYDLEEMIPDYEQLYERQPDLAGLTEALELLLQARKNKPQID